MVPMKSNAFVLFTLCFLLTACNPKELPQQKEVPPGLAKFRSVFQNADSITLSRLEPDTTTRGKEGNYFKLSAQA